MRFTGGSNARRVPPRHDAAVYQRTEELRRKFDWPDFDTKPPPFFNVPDQGAYTHLARGTVQEIDVGGEAIEWNTEFLTAHLQFVVELPAIEITIPKSGYYDIAVGLEWDTWDGGGSVWIERNQSGGITQIAPSEHDPGLWTATDGQRGSWIAKGVPLEGNDTITIYVDHGDGSTQDLALAVLEVEYIHSGQAVAQAQNLFIFTEDGTLSWEEAGFPDTLDDVWIIGGGGGGAKGLTGDWKGGGGGAGGLLHLTNYAMSGDIAVTVGLGGSGGVGAGLAQGTTGEDSTFDGTEIADGGGRGGVGTTDAAGSGLGGGCGGGGTTAGAISSGTGGTGTQGGNGGSAPVANNASGGGGGIDATGGSGVAGSGGPGGVGIDLSLIVGTSYGEAGWFGGGGGGHGTSSGAAGGQGGGGDGSTGAGADGLVNSGGGGGGGATTSGGDGGSGIVIVRVRS